MITTQDILEGLAVQINSIGDLSKADIYTDEWEYQKHLDGSDAIFLNATLLDSSVSTINTNAESVIIDITYATYIDDRKKDYLRWVETRFRSIFARSFKVGDYFLHIKGSNSTIVEDEVGWRLNFSMIVEYHNKIFDSTIIGGIKLPGTNNIEVLDSTELMKEVIISSGKER